MGLALTKEYLLPWQVLDTDNLIGVVQIENILIFAESYDVALDITFPKGLLTPPKKECLEVTSFRAVCFLCRERAVIIGEKDGIEVNSEQANSSDVSSVTTNINLSNQRQ